MTMDPMGFNGRLDLQGTKKSQPFQVARAIRLLKTLSDCGEQLSHGPKTRPDT